MLSMLAISRIARGRAPKVLPVEPGLRGRAAQSAGGDRGSGTRSGAARLVSRLRGRRAGDSPATGLPEGSVVIAASIGGSDDEEWPSLLTAGALAALQIAPAETRLERLGQRRLRARPFDADGVLILRPVDIEWSKDEYGRVVPAHGARVVFQAGPDTGTATVKAVARESGRSAEATAIIHLVEAAEEARRTGIPEPVLVDEPAAGWRSRMRDGAWEVNSAHPDFRIAAVSGRLKLRYLAALLAKEIVLHSFPAPQIEPILERLVAVPTITEWRLERN